MVTQQRCQGGPAPGAPGLDGALGDPEQVGGLGHRQALHLDQHEGQSLRLGQPGQGGLYVVPQVGAVVLVVPCRDVVVAQRVGWPGLATSHAVDAGVDHDAVQPGGHGRVTAVGARIAEGRDQGVLQCVRRLVGITHRPQRHRPQPVAVTVHQHGEGVGVAGQMSLHQRPVVGLTLEGGRTADRWRVHDRDTSEITSLYSPPA